MGVSLDVGAATAAVIQSYFVPVSFFSIPLHLKLASNPQTTTLLFF